MAIAFGSLAKYEVEAYIDGEEITISARSLIEAKAEARKLKAEGARNIIIHDFTGANPNGIRV
jgi:hypothetical protein